MNMAHMIHPKIKIVTHFLLCHMLGRRLAGLKLDRLGPQNASLAVGEQPSSYSCVETSRNVSCWSIILEMVVIIGPGRHWHSGTLDKLCRLALSQVHTT